MRRHVTVPSDGVARSEFVTPPPAPRVRTIRARRRNLSTRE